MNVQNPLVLAFAEQVGRRGLLARPEAIRDCEPLFRHLLDPQFAESVLADALRQMVDDPTHAGTHRDDGLLLAEAPGWRLRLGLLQRPRRYIHSNPRHAFVAPVGGQPLRVDLYELPAGFRAAVFDSAQKLGRGESRQVPPGELLELRVGGTLVDYRVDADAPMLLLIFEGAPIEALEWRFSRDTLHAWQVTDADPAVGDLKAAAWLAGRLAHQTSLKPLKVLAAHAHPGVRWAAMQGVGRLSRSEANRLLVQALDDPHPQVRRLAKLALDRDDAETTGSQRSWR